MARIGLMDVSVKRRGNEVIPIENMLTRFTENDLFFHLGEAENRTSESVSYAFNAVAYIFRGLSPATIFREQYTAEITPSRKLHSMPDEVADEAHANLQYHLGIFKGAPFLLGGGNQFAPIPLGKDSWIPAVTSPTDKMDRLIFARLLETGFSKIGSLTLFRPVVSLLGRNNRTVKQVEGFIKEWVAQEKEKTHSPWAFEKSQHGPEYYITLDDGNQLPWNR